MHKNYALVEEREIEYLNDRLPGNCRLLEHKTGAKVVFINNGDPISVFSLAFLTPPVDDTGAAHIVEHCLLSGSEKYPVKDPSAELEKGVVYTYLNALTFNDMTVYMGGSYDETSLFHIMDVYYDAVFRPNICKVKETFLREGWHFEYNGETDEIGIGGIVYNEMKASYGEPSGELFNKAKKGLFPYSNMRFCNAGIASDIPNVTYEQILAYYNNHYTADNCTAFFYGSLDENKCLEKLDHYLCNALANGTFEKPPKPFIDNSLNEVYLNGTYILPENDNPQNKRLMSLMYVLEDGSYADGNLLYNILLGSVTSPLYAGLMEMKFAENIFGSFNREYGLPTYFCISAQNCGDNIDIEYFKNAVEKVLSDIVENGIDKEIISNAYRFMEIFYREKNFGFRTTGIAVALDAASCIINGRDIFIFLDWLNLMQKNKEKALNGRYFEDLTKKILESKRRAYTTLTPSHAKLEHSILNNLTNKQREHIKNDKTLEIFNNTPDSEENLAKIPHTLLSDMKRGIQKIPPYEVLDGKILTVPLQSNGITYINIYFDASFVPTELWGAMGLMCRLLNYIGTAKTPYIEFANKLNKYTGDFSWDIAAIPLYASHKIKPCVCLSLKTPDANAADTFALARESVNDTVFNDKGRIEELMTSFTASWRGSIATDARRYAALSLNAADSVGGLLNDSCGGLKYMRYISSLGDCSEALSEDLTRVYNIVFGKSAPFVSVGAERSCINRLIPLSIDFIDSVTKKADSGLRLTNINDMPYMPQTVRKAIIIPSESAFNVLSAPIPFGDIETTASINVMSSLLNGSFLTPKIRLWGGAYGCNALYNDFSGRFYTDSFRDPNIAETYEIFKAIPNFIKNAKFTSGDIENAALTLISVSDRPRRPLEEFAFATAYYLTGRDGCYYQELRDNYFAMTAKKIGALAPRLEQSFANVNICTLAGTRQIEKHKGLFDSIEHL